MSESEVKKIHGLTNFRLQIYYTINWLEESTKQDRFKASKIAETLVDTFKIPATRKSVLNQLVSQKQRNVSRLYFLCIFQYQKALKSE